MSRPKAPRCLVQGLGQPREVLAKSFWRAVDAVIKKYGLPKVTGWACCVRTWDRGKFRHPHYAYLGHRLTELGCAFVEGKNKLTIFDPGPMFLETWQPSRKGE